jgi:hypothetical protein
LAACGGVSHSAEVIHLRGFLAVFELLASKPNEIIGSAIAEAKANHWSVDTAIVDEYGNLLR